MSINVYLKAIAMAAARITSIQSRAVAWGDGLGIRIPKPLAKAAGIELHTVLSVWAHRGRIVIKARSDRPSLTSMLAAFDPKRHGGEAMAQRPVGREVL